MSCLYCGAEEDRIDGYCSIYCRDIAEAENDYYDLLKRVREAYNEMEAEFEKPELQGLFAEGMEHAYFTIKKHLPELEDK